jgi:hypothetical protein
MSFTGNESHIITLQEATDWTKNYRDIENEDGSKTKAHFFGINKLNQILNQEGCVGIRAYYAIDDDGQKQLVLVGAMENEEDIYEGVILDKSVPCPSHCAALSPLNS